MTAIWEYVPLVPVFPLDYKGTLIVRVIHPTPSKLGTWCDNGKGGAGLSAGIGTVLKATALTVALLVREIGPVYKLDDCVGVADSQPGRPRFSIRLTLSVTETEPVK